MTSPAVTTRVHLGSHQFDCPIILAPMAGVSDRPFRDVCRRLGADYAVAEMVSSRPELWRRAGTRRRLDFAGEAGLRVAQIAGADPRQMADAARRAVDFGADVVDINMGCPAKKVCNQLAGSALLRDEALVGRILDAVCGAVPVPVTLKTRTGWSPAARNGPRIARLAEAAGVAVLTVHGRTRACRFRGRAEYDTIAEIKTSVNIPVIANGDVTSAADALAVLAHTGADGLMIGRAALGDPWIFARVRAALDGRPAPRFCHAERARVMAAQVAAMHALYGEGTGLRNARKHVGPALEAWPDGAALRQVFNAIDSAGDQLAYLAALEGEALERAA